MKTKACCLVVSLLQLYSSMENQLFAQPSQPQTNLLSWTCWRVLHCSELKAVSVIWVTLSLIFLTEVKQNLAWMTDLLRTVCLMQCKKGAWHERKLKWWMMFIYQCKPFRQHIFRTCSWTIGDFTEGVLLRQKMQVLSLKWSCSIDSLLTAELYRVPLLVLMNLKNLLGIT